MQINLTRTQAKLVQREMRLGKYASPRDVVDNGLRKLAEEREYEDYIQSVRMKLVAAEKSVKAGKTLKFDLEKFKSGVRTRWQAKKAHARG